MSKERSEGRRLETRLRYKERKLNGHQLRIDTVLTTEETTRARCKGNIIVHTFFRTYK